MDVKVLINDSSLPGFYAEHGFSLYLKTLNKEIIFDLGASDCFLENAKKLNVSLAHINYVIISHGHYDHGGGLKTLLKATQDVEVFIHHQAIKPLYSFKENSFHEINFDIPDKFKNNLILTGKRFFIQEGLQLFTTPIQNYPLPLGNKTLFWDDDGRITNDPFEHEQNLLIDEDGKLILIAGCAHRGIINVIEYAKLLKGRYPDYVIGGFHLIDKPGNESPEMIADIGKHLRQTKALFYTGHCTSEKAYVQLKEVLAHKLQPLKAGMKIKL